MLHEILWSQTAKLLPRVLSNASSRPCLFFSGLFSLFLGKDTLRNSQFVAEAGAQNAIDPTASLLQQCSLFVWDMMVFTGLQRGPICAFPFFFCARLWTLSGSYTQHKDVDSYTNTHRQRGLSGQRGMAARLGL